MRHLISFSVYQGPSELKEGIDVPLSAIGCDGVELLTAYSPISPAYVPDTVSVHLPFAADWLAAWEGRPYDMDDVSALYYMMGRTREDVVANLRKAIDVASAVSPCHGVLHACDVDLRELVSRRFSLDSGKVLRTFCEMVNEAVSGMPGGEPPFTILFENLWWPGLRLLDDSDFKLIDSRIEFEDWGICLDTGHMMNCLPVRTQEEGIESLRKVFEGYGEDLIDRIRAMHLHYSASGDYRGSFEERPYEEGPIVDFIATAYPHISKVDQHLPFTDGRCRELVGMLSPDVVIHELPGHGTDPLDEFRIQRSHFDT